MEVKGTAVSTVKDFVNTRYKEKYDEWLEKLMPVSQQIFRDPIYATSWYDLKYAIIEPSKVISEMFFNNELEKACFELGRFSSETALKGIYKIFIKVSSPLFVLSRINTIFETYYRPSDNVKVVEKTNNSAIMEFTRLNKEESLILYRVAGWSERTIEICGFKNVSARVEQVNDPNILRWRVICTWK